MVQWKHEGFTIDKVTHLAELQADLYQMTHEKTGLELVWLKRDEENKTFGIAFQTLPWDDTGVFHILEHSVLCGSNRYPVKEAFVELMKGSMNTFLNALTFPDKTFYPVSSRNAKDFVNLMRVYLDAVFCPLIYTRPEIFYQEGWHYELDESGKAGYKGVVFNEMKGAFASADTLMDNALNRLLFPDSPYGFVSGGDPAAIPDLSYEAFLDSHRKFYAPSNAYVFLDGDMDIENVLGIINDEYLCHYEKTQRMAPPSMQKAVCGNIEMEYELSPGEPMEGKVRLGLGKVIGGFEDREKLTAMQVLSETLCGSNHSPLCRAILEAELAEQVSMDVSDGIMQPWVMLNVINLCQENLEKIETCIRETLQKLADEGLDHNLLEAVMANMEFQMRERDYGEYPRGVAYGFSVLDSWLYGGDPAAHLEVGDLFVGLRQKMQEGYFENLIREVLLDNPHSAKVVLKPSYTAGEARRAQEQARLDACIGQLDDAGRAQIEKTQANLMAWHEAPDDPEALATIPQLTLEDIPAVPERIPTEVLEISGLPVIRHALSTGGIAYVNLYFDADSLDESALSSLAFACSLLGESDTLDRDAESVLNRTRLLCGSFETYLTSFVVDGDAENTTTKLCVGFSALESRLDEAVDHVMEVMTRSQFCDEIASDLLHQIKMDLFQKIVMDGASVGLNRIMAQFSPAGVVEEFTGGIEYYQWLKATDENWDFEALNGRMEALLKAVVCKKGLTVSISGISDERAEVLVNQVMASIPDGEENRPKPQIRPWGKRREGILIPADVSFAVMGGDLKAHGSAYTGQMPLVNQIITLDYLWNVIRVQGGAYGTGLVSRENGLTACYSYRDPNGSLSLERYRDCAKCLREVVESESDFTAYIIGAVAMASPLMTARTMVSVGDSHYFAHMTWEKRCLRRKQLLEASASDLMNLAEALEGVLNDGGICLVGGQEQLEMCKALDSVIAL